MTLAKTEALEAFMDGIRASISGTPFVDKHQSKIADGWTQDGGDSRMKFATKTDLFDLGAKIGREIRIPVFGVLPKLKYMDSIVLEKDGICVRGSCWENEHGAYFDVLYRVS